MICQLCFHHCDLSEGQTGFCRARACRDGAIVPLNYGKAVCLALDPIEKKPLRRFHPGSKILSDDGQAAYAGGTGVSPGRCGEGVPVFRLYGELLMRNIILRIPMPPDS